MSDDSNDLTGRVASMFNRIKGILVYASILLFVFLLGLLPMWWRLRSCTNQLTAVQASLSISSLQNKLANAGIDARRGDYEPARKTLSEFFNNLRTELDRGSASAFNEQQRNSLSALFSGRDDVITLLARSDPASGDRLLELYQKYRQIAGNSEH